MDDHREGIQAGKPISSWERFGFRDGIQAEKPVPPWERPGYFRRDYKPHRGLMLEWLGLLSMLTAGLSVIPIPFVAATVGIAIGLATCWSAKQDVAQMQRGRMDPRGEAETCRAWEMGVIGIVLNAVAGVIGTVVFLATGM